MALLEISEMTVTYGALRAVDGVSMTVSAGEISGLVGPNGSGKSTLLNGVSGFVPVAGGAVRVDAEDVSAAPSHRLARLGVSRTFQLMRILPGMTVEENVAAGCHRLNVASGLRSLAQLYRRSRLGDTRERVAAAMERTGIAAHKDELIDELPFGTQRRMEIARAIVAEPRLLLFDEPAAGLGERDLDDLARIVDEEIGRGCAIVLVDHHLHFVRRLCPRIVVLNFGNKIFDGSSQAAMEDQGVREAYVGI